MMNVCVSAETTPYLMTMQLEAARYDVSVRTAAVTDVTVLRTVAVYDCT